MILTIQAHAQLAERKIIVQNGKFYYTTVDEEFQIATLHTGDISKPVKNAKHFGLPAGRNYNVPVNPFSWDISDSSMYAINFLQHPLNDRNEALKRFGLAGLREWDSTLTIQYLLVQSTEMNTFTLNDPYQDVISTTKYLDDLYFDGIAGIDSTYYMAVSIQNEIVLWHYNGKNWTKGKSQKLSDENGCFSLFSFKNQLYLFFPANGKIMKAGMSGFTLLPNKAAALITGGILVENRDTKEISCIDPGDILQNLSMEEILEKKSTRIF